MKKAIKIALPILFTVFFLYIAVSKISWTDFWSSIQQTSWTVVLLASVLAVLSVVIRAWRWQILLNPIKKLPYSSVVNFAMIGFMTNNILPAHAGDLVRGILLAKSHKVSAVSALATILVARLFDGLALLTILAALITMIPLPTELQVAGLTASILFISLIGFVLSLAYFAGLRKWLQDWLVRLPERFRHKAIEKYEAFLLGLESLKDWRNLIPIYAISLLVWMEMGLTVYVVMKGFPLGIISETQIALGALTVTVFLAFAVALPSTPGYVGVTQAMFVLTLGLFGISEVNALSASVLFNLTQYIPVTLFGFLALVKEGFGFRELFVQQDAADSDPAILPDKTA